MSLPLIYVALRLAIDWVTEVFYGYLAALCCTTSCTVPGAAKEAQPLQEPAEAWQGLLQTASQPVKSEIMGSEDVSTVNLKSAQVCR
jgi:hypothetical protein